MSRLLSSCQRRYQIGTRPLRRTDHHGGLWFCLSSSTASSSLNLTCSGVSTRPGVLLAATLPFKSGSTALSSLLAQHMVSRNSPASSPRSGLSSVSVPADFDACSSGMGAAAGLVSLLVVRNPYERMLSYYIDKVQRPRPYRRSSRRPNATSDGAILLRESTPRMTPRPISFRDWLLGVTTQPPSLGMPARCTSRCKGPVDWATTQGPAAAAAAAAAASELHTGSDAARCDSGCEARKHYEPISTAWPMSCVSARVLRLEVRAHAPSTPTRVTCRHIPISRSSPRALNAH